MNVQQIAIADIEMDKFNPEYRTFSRDFATTLAKSIESEGLLHEPTVRPVAGKPGKYKVIAGKHRAYACAKVLKWEEIPCKVAPADMTEDEAIAIEDAENIFRNNLSEAQFKKALIRWQRIHDAKHPAASGKGAFAKQKAIVRQRVEEAKAKGEEVDEKQVAAEVAAENKPLTQMVQQTLKVSATTAGRLVRIAKHLEPEQIDILEKHKVTDHITELIAALCDKELISKAINLIASGMDHMEAVRQAGKGKRDVAKSAEKNGPPTQEQKSMVPKPGKVVPVEKPVKDKEMTDEDWLDTHCDKILKLLKRKAAFKRDAIIYRRLADTLVKFRTSTKKAIAEGKSADGNGGFYSSLVRVTRATHPRDWLVCSNCNGQGYVLGPDEARKEVKKTCPSCNGAGYKLNLEPQ